MTQKSSSIQHQHQPPDYQPHHPLQPKRQLKQVNSQPNYKGMAVVPLDMTVASHAPPANSRTGKPPREADQASGATNKEKEKGGVAVAASGGSDLMLPISNVETVVLQDDDDFGKGRNFTTTPSNPAIANSNNLNH